MSKVVLESTITCPKCGHQKEEMMPTDACQYFYECQNCKEMLKPTQGDVVFIAAMAVRNAHQFNKKKTAVDKSCKQMI